MFYLLIPAVISGLAALVFMERASAYSQRHGSIRFRVTAKEFLRTNKNKIDDYLQNDKLNQLFKEAGNPLGITGMTYQYFRYTLIVFYLVSQLPDFLQYPEIENLIRITFGVGLLYVLSMPGEYLPITRILQSVKEYNIAEKNRELYMLYTLIADEIRSAKNDRMNLRALLEELRDYTNLIRPAIDRTLLNYDKGLSFAMSILAHEIGTVEADEMAKIFADLEESDAEKAIQLIDARRETFITNQKENKRRKMKALGNYGYVVAYIPLLIYGWNFMNLIMAEVQFLTDFTNLR